MLWYCRPLVQTMFSMGQVLNYNHNDSGHRMKVDIDLGYCSHTHFHTDPNVKKMDVSVICAWKVNFSLDFDVFFF